MGDETTLENDVYLFDKHVDEFDHDFTSFSVNHHLHLRENSAQLETNSGMTEGFEHRRVVRCHEYKFHFGRC